MSSDRSTPATEDGLRCVKCPGCEEILADPVAMLPCGHITCFNCFHEAKGEEERRFAGLLRCDSCGREVESFVYQDTLEEVIDRLLFAHMRDGPHMNKFVNDRFRRERANIRYRREHADERDFERIEQERRREMRRLGMELERTRAELDIRTQELAEAERRAKAGIEAEHQASKSTAKASVPAGQQAVKQLGTAAHPIRLDSPPPHGRNAGSLVSVTINQGSR